jgi:hypothetical protein
LRCSRAELTSDLRGLNSVYESVVIFTERHILKKTELLKTADLLGHSGPQTDAPLLSFVVRGGEAMATEVPIGKFALKAASGEHLMRRKHRC